MVFESMVFESNRARDHVIRSGVAVEGGMQTIGRLAEYLADTRRGAP